MEREPLDIFLELHTPPLLATHVEVGTGMLGTCLGYVTICWSSDLRSHSSRATSCRTPTSRTLYGTAATAVSANARSYRMGIPTRGSPLTKPLGGRTVTPGA
jgi:hypothetical protein